MDLKEINCVLDSSASEIRLLTMIVNTRTLYVVGNFSPCDAPYTSQKGPCSLLSIT